ncbi:MAG: internal scaffolding protein [Arizlama microvirus]|nr:MAG: internal scaffolding protein [Arizlama microvirus]
MDNVFARNAYNYDTDAASKFTGLVTTLPSLAQQQYKDESDINTIAKNFGLTGKLPAPVYLPTFGDFSDVSDFQSALHAIQRANASFDAMPSHVRERFANDPQQFLEFTSDTRNAEELRKLGLFKDAPSPPPSKPGPVNPTPLSPPDTTN